jgi:ketosteroid isomerase-like protein
MQERLVPLLLSLVFACLCGNAFSEAVKNDTQTTMEVTRLLQKWQRDFNAKNFQAVCDLFAPDLVATYPGAKDRNYAEMCRSLTRAMNNPEKSYSYQPPKIEQVIADDNLAVVRLIWTLVAESRGIEGTEIVIERGLDVFRRQKDGSWKIAVSYAYPQNLGE